jgi:hypothetical protein
VYKNLSDDQIRQIGAEYFSERKEKSHARKEPVIVFVGAQPGAGKSVTAEVIRRELIARGGYIHVDADRMRVRIPTGKAKPSSEETQTDAGKLANAVRALAIDGRRNIIEEGTLRSPGVMGTVASMAHSQGYRVELVALAAHKEESLLGVYERFEKQHLNPALNPRFVSENYHDDAFNGFTKNVAKDADKFDRVRVVNREGQMLFDSAAPENGYPSANEALQQGRELTPKRRSTIMASWEEVKKLAEVRNAPREYLGRIEMHRSRNQLPHEKISDGSLSHE